MSKTQRVKKWSRILCKIIDSLRSMYPANQYGFLELKHRSRILGDRDLDHGYFWQSITGKLKSLFFSPPLTSCYRSCQPSFTDPAGQWNGHRSSTVHLYRYCLQSVLFNLY